MEDSVTHGQSKFAHSWTWRKTPIIMFAELFGMFSQLFELLDELVELFELFASLFEFRDELFRELFWEWVWKVPWGSLHIYCSPLLAHTVTINYSFMCGHHLHSAILSHRFCIYPSPACHMQLFLMDNHRRPCSSDIYMPKWATRWSTIFLNSLRKNLGSIKINVQADDFLWSQSYCCELCVAVCALLEHNFLFELAGRPPAITHTHFCAPYSKTKIKEVCVDTLCAR